VLGAHGTAVGEALRGRAKKLALVGDLLGASTAACSRSLAGIELDCDAALCPTHVRALGQCLHPMVAAPAANSALTLLAVRDL
jgi:hypothetical protein